MSVTGKSKLIDLLANVTLDNIEPHEAEMLAYIYETALDSIPLHEYALFAADEFFGERLDDERDHLFLSSPLESTEGLCSEFIMRLGEVFESRGFIKPRCFVMQALRRKAGYSTKNQKLPGQYAAVMCLKDTQILRSKDEDLIISTNKIAGPFDLAVEKPFIYRNKTRYHHPEHGWKLKPRDYLSIIVWAFWDECPLQKSDNNDSNEKTD